MQTTSNLLMIRPVNFLYNEQTAVNNAFQVSGEDKEVQQKALKEFDDFVLLLLLHGINVTVLNDTPEPHTPDSIFPNNWISTDKNGVVCLYPMFAPNRRHERKPEVLKKLSELFTINETIDFSVYENESHFLEGTGSMILDRDNKIAYACLSPRTDEALFKAFCKKFDYLPVAFTAVDSNGALIYHTNVMMCVADRYVVICTAGIRDAEERTNVVTLIQNSGKAVVDITLAQMNHFAGNMLQVHNKEGQKFLVMSSQAYGALTKEQVEKLSAFNPILHSSLTTIEANGGGSARCMMAEIFLPGK